MGVYRKKDKIWHIFATICAKHKICKRCCHEIHELVHRELSIYCANMAHGRCIAEHTLTGVEVQCIGRSIFQDIENLMGKKSIATPHSQSHTLPVETPRTPARATTTANLSAHLVTKTTAIPSAYFKCRSFNTHHT